MSQFDNISCAAQSVVSTSTRMRRIVERKMVLEDMHQKYIDSAENRKVLLSMIRRATIDERMKRGGLLNEYLDEIKEQDMMRAQNDQGK